MEIEDMINLLKDGLVDLLEDRDIHIITNREKIFIIFNEDDKFDANKEFEITIKLKTQTMKLTKEQRIKEIEDVLSGRVNMNLSESVGSLTKELKELKKQ